MVTSLQSTGKTALLDGLLAKSASKDFLKQGHITLNY